MKMYFDSIRYSRHLYVAAFVTFLSVFGLSCSKDDNPVVVPPDNTVTNEKMVLYRYSNNQSLYRVNHAGTSLGSEICSGMEYDGDYMTGVDAGRHWVAMHSGDMEFQITKVYSNGEVGSITDYQEWNSNYETFVGFHVGTRGYIFGQDSHDNKWFIQEIMPDGKLAENESNHGTWHNYYKTCVPVYMNGNTFLFFQTKESDHYWFMTRVDENSNMTDVDDGYWGDFWVPVVFYQMDGKGYLVGECEDGNGDAAWFIQVVNPDGTLGPETDRGLWGNFYIALAAFTSNGHTYLYGGADNAENDARNVFIQEVTADGKMGAEMSHFTSDYEYASVIPFTIHDQPGGFRYTIGWDLSATSAAPAGDWSAQFQDPWNGEINLGGGAALANIDGDVNGRQDAVLMGIQSLKGGDRCYYKVAWNLDNTGKASGWSADIFGPYIGQMQSGGGADIADIDGNGVPDLLLMVVDNPEQGNAYFYNIGWNLGADGQPASWSQTVRVGGLGNDDAGGGAALGDLDRNGKIDAVFVGIDNPQQGNTFWYTVGQNFAADGKATAWTNHVIAPCNLGWENSGGGAALADLNGNGKPDLILTGIDNPSGANPFWYFVGWDLDINGNVTGWSGKLTGPALGNISSGGGLAVGDINKNGKPDLFLMSVDDPYGKDN